MSVITRRTTSGSWEVDLHVVLPDGRRHRVRRRIKVSSKSAAERWGREHERKLLTEGLPKQDQRKEVPTLEEFAPSFLDGHAKANRHKPSGIAAKETILRVHLVPRLGTKRLDAIRTEDIQRLKSQLSDKAPKTVNNILTTLNTLLRMAVEWGVIGELPCRIRLLPAPKPSAVFHDFEAFDHLVETAQSIDWQTHLLVLLGGEAGLRCGEMMALEWSDLDFRQNQVCVQRSDWNGHVTVPEREDSLRYVPHDTPAGGGPAGDSRHLHQSHVWCANRRRHAHCHPAEAPELDEPRGAPELDYRERQGSTCSAIRSAHIFAMRGAPARAIQELAGHQDLSTTQRYMHLSPAAIDRGHSGLLDRPAFRAKSRVLERMRGDGEGGSRER